MADPAKTGSDVSSGTYKCTKCGQEISAPSIESLPPCPQCNNTDWQSLSGGDSVKDPYPNS